MRAIALFLILLLIGSLILITIPNAQSTYTLNMFNVLSLRPSSLNKTIGLGNQFLISVMLYPNQKAFYPDTQAEHIPLLRLQSNNFYLNLWLKALLGNNGANQTILSYSIGNSTYANGGDAGALSSGTSGNLVYNYTFIAFYVDNVNSKMYFYITNGFMANSGTNIYTLSNWISYPNNVILNSIGAFNLTIGYGYIYQAINIITPNSLVNGTGYISNTNWLNSTITTLANYQKAILINTNAIAPLTVSQSNIVVNLQPYSIFAKCNQWFDLASGGHINLYGIYQYIRSITTTFQITCLQYTSCTNVNAIGFAVNNTALGGWSEQISHQNFTNAQAPNGQASLITYISFRVYNSQILVNNPNVIYDVLHLHCDFLYSASYILVHHDYWIGLSYNGSYYNLAIKYGNDYTPFYQTYYIALSTSSINGILYEITVFEYFDQSIYVYINNSLVKTINNIATFFNANNLFFYKVGYNTPTQNIVWFNIDFNTNTPIIRYSTVILLNQTFTNTFAQSFVYNATNFDTNLINGNYYLNQNPFFYLLTNGYTNVFFLSPLTMSNHYLFPNSTNTIAIDSTKNAVFYILKNQIIQGKPYNLILGDLKYGKINLVTIKNTTLIPITFISDYKGAYYFGQVCSLPLSYITNPQNSTIAGYDITPWIYLILPFAFMLLLMQFDRKYWLIGLIIGFIVASIIFPINWVFVIILSIFAFMYYRK